MIKRGTKREFFETKLKSSQTIKNYFELVRLSFGATHFYQDLKSFIQKGCGTTVCHILFLNKRRDKSGIFGDSYLFLEAEHFHFLSYD